MTPFEQFREQLRGILTESPYQKDTNMIAEKMWKLKDATYINLRKDFIEESDSWINLCLMLLKIKEGKVDKLYADCPKKISIDLPTGFEKLLEEDIAKIGLNLRNIEWTEFANLILQNEAWLNALLINKLILPYKHNLYEEYITPTILIIEENDDCSKRTNNTQTKDISKTIKNILQRVADGETLNGWEDDVYTNVVTAYCQCHDITTAETITIDFLKKRIKELNRGKNEKFKNADPITTKRAIAISFFLQNGYNRHLDEHINIKRSDIKYIKSAFKIAGLIEDMPNTIKKTGRRNRNDKLINYAIQLLQQGACWNEYSNEIFIMPKPY